jgi:aminoglycoside phosphotransferase (APT) family kinase protein
MAPVVARIERLREAGVPAPVTTVVGDGPDVLLVHDYLPGDADPPLTADLVGALLAVVERESKLADESAADWSRLMKDSLTTGLRGYCEHRSLARFSKESRRLLDRVRSVGSDPAVDSLAAPDLVHFDLHPSNVLSTDGRQVSGIVDWDAARAGDRALDLALLAFTCSWRTHDQALLERLWDAFLGTGTEDTRQIYMHHVALRIVDWFLRHGGPIGSERTIALATWALDLTAQGRYTPPVS